MKNNSPQLKLNYKRTFIIGLAFFTILLLWQVYNSQCPLILNVLLCEALGGNTGDYDYIIGVIMALDNLFALFMIPITGHFSDKTKTKLGKRMPYILVGTIASAIAFPFIAISFVAHSLVGVIVSMLLVLVFMYLYRGPAVALMPDVTPKPLRATANGIINVVGYIGAIFGGILYMIPMFKMPKDLSTLNAFNYILPYILVSVLLIIALVILVLTVKENKILAEMKAELDLGERLAASAEVVEEDKPLSKKNKRDLWLTLIAIFIWFMAFNAVETFWTSYCTTVIGTAESNYSLPTTVLPVVSLLAFIPGSMLSNKIGRKYTIVIGIILCTICMTFGCFFMSAGVYDNMTLVFAIFFAIAGIGWAFINVASYPMIVELSTKSTVGKFTGYYYTASMLAQTVTPIAIGAIMSFTDFGRKALFPYSAILFVAALVVFILVTNVKPKEQNTKKGLEAIDN